MTAAERTLMQPDDSVDTPEIARLKKLYWDLENRHREYPSMPVEEVQVYILEVVPILAEYAATTNQPSVNRVYPRTPLPTDRDGMIRNGEITKHALTAHNDKTVRVHEKDVRWLKGSSFAPDTRVLHMDTNGVPLRDHDD